MTKYVAFHRASTSGNDAMFSVHRDGCKDIAREVRKYMAEPEGTFDSRQAAVDGILTPDMRERGYDESFIKVYPC